MFFRSSTGVQLESGPRRAMSSAANVAKLDAPQPARTLSAATTTPHATRRWNFRALAAAVVQLGMLVTDAYVHLLACFQSVTASSLQHDEHCS